LGAVGSEQQVVTGNNDYVDLPHWPRLLALLDLDQDPAKVVGVVVQRVPTRIGSFSQLVFDGCAGVGEHQYDYHDAH